MLLTIHNLPPACRYSDIKNLLSEKCGLSEIILDNLVAEGKGKKVTVGLANDDDGALVVRKINGLNLNGNQLYIEDRRRKTGERDQPYRASNIIPEARSIEPPLSNNPMGGMPMAANVPMMWNMATPYVVQVPVDQNFAYGGYGGASQAAHYMEPQPVVPAEPERGYSRFQGESYPPVSVPREQDSSAWGRSGRKEDPDNYRHPDRKRHHSPERPGVPKKRETQKETRWDEKEAPKRRELSPPRQQWPQDMNQGPRPSFRQPEQFARDQNQYQPRGSKPDYRAPEPQWENRWDAPKPRVEREREWGNGNNQNWEPKTDKVWENQPNPNWQDEPMQGNNEPVPGWEGEYSHIPERDGPEWFDRQPENQMDQYRGDQFYERRPIEHESRPRQREADWNDRRPQNDRGAPRRPPNDRDVPGRPQSDRDIPRRPQNERDAFRRAPNDRDVPRRPPNDRDAPRRPQSDRDAPRRSQNDRDAPRRPHDDREPPRRPQNDRDTWGMSREPVGPGVSRSLSSSNRNSRRDEPPRRDRSRSNNAPQGRDFREDRRNPPHDFPGGEKPDYWGQIADDYPEPNKPEYRREDFNAPRRERNQGYIADVPKKPAMREERYPHPSKEDRRYPPQKPIDPQIDLRKKPQTLTNLINRDSCVRGQATAMIAKLMLGIRGKTQFTSSLNAFIFKQLKHCIKARVDVLLGEELSSDMDEVIKRYRAKFPTSGDKVLLQQIREKSIKEFDAMYEQGKMTDSNPEKKQQDNATATPNTSQNAAPVNEAKTKVNTDAAITNATVVAPTVGNNATVTVPMPKVINNATVVPAPKVIPPGPPLPKPKGKKPLTDKQVIKNIKLQRNWEYKQDDIYNLNAVSKKALDDEIALLDKLFEEECSTPADPQEEQICKRITSDCLNDFNKSISLYITKRFLNIQTGLAVRLYAMGKLPKKEAVKQYLKRYRIEALKKSVKGNMYVLNLSRFQDFDTLCQMENGVIDGTPVQFKAMNLSGPPLKISRNQVMKMRQQQIQGQIEDFDMADFEETTDYTEDVGGTGEANEDFAEDVVPGDLTDVTGDFAEDAVPGDLTDVTGDFAEDVVPGDLTDVTGAFAEDGVPGDLTDVTGDFAEGVVPGDFGEHATGNVTENVNTEDFTENVETEGIKENVTENYTEDVKNDFTGDDNVGGNVSEDVNNENAEDGDTENADFDVIDDVNIDHIDDDDLEDF